MNVSRAGFLRICSSVLLGRTANISSSRPSVGSVGGVLAAEAPGLSRVPFRMEDASAALFQPYLDTMFDVRTNEGTRLPLVLSRVTEQPVTRDVEQFSLSFHARGGATLPSGTHAFQHPALGAFYLFIAPVGASIERTEYEACFSRHLSAKDTACR